ncbi:major head protein [Aeromonas phage BUCT695]|uniref:major head protein n=1 Tax=Aeromonas phage BUCT695 TaxID=2908630 RepID=UPI0023297525|nr:major head protein [Aeromonas phage BUCT695]UIW10598.1 capsid and scaffold protein [Aeromonas phage BUCT695]
MADNTLVSYDLNGKKLSFANWISNLSPTDTPFVSMTGKEAINQTLFQWQTDTLASANANNAVVEGSAAVDEKRTSTFVMKNITQILRKVVRVSDTANALANYGRGRELQYQMEKAGKEIKRDLEMALLHNGVAKEEDGHEGVGAGVTHGRKTAGFQGMVGGVPRGKTAAEPDPDTGAVVFIQAKAGKLTEDDLFGLTYNLYLSGSQANIIMFHPKHASFFSSLMETSPQGRNRTKMFDGQDTKFNQYVSTLVTPLGCEFKLIPNRWMPEDAIYAFTPSDWTQMVLRAPQRTKLAKDGSYEKWMIEMEVGLRHRNPYASGILKL